MACCKDCISYSVCMDYTNLKESEFAQNFNETGRLCEHFKDKAGYAEVVRCKDCVKKVDYKGRVVCSKNAIMICGELCGLTATDSEHFCSYGKREEDSSVNGV